MRLVAPTTKYFVLLVGALALFTASHSVGRADELFTAGFTDGCFGSGCTPGASATFLGLTYSNATFAGTTASGFRALGGNANPGANFNNLGPVTLSTAPNVFNNQSFALQITFTGPQGISSSNQTRLSASITGTVRNDNSGGVFLDFNNTPIRFTYNDTNCEPDPTGGVPGQQTTCGGAGEFYLTINDVAVDPGQTVALTGQISQYAPPVASSSSLNWRGAWNAGVTYQPGDAVSFGGSSWVAKRANTGVQPVEGADWDVLALKGDQGVPGSQGLSGAQGIKGDKGDTGAQGPVGPAANQNTFPSAQSYTFPRTGRLTITDPNIKADSTILLQYVGGEIFPLIPFNIKAGQFTVIGVPTKKFRYVVFN
jgi:hypothetical protein